MELLVINCFGLKMNLTFLKKLYLELKFQNNIKLTDFNIK